MFPRTNLCKMLRGASEGSLGPAAESVRFKETRSVQTTTAPMVKVDRLEDNLHEIQDKEVNAMQ